MGKIGNKFVYFLLILLLISINLNIYFFLKNRVKNIDNKTNLSNTSVIRVIDGDTFDTEKGDRIRLYLIDAPEYPNQCLSLQSKQRLEELILNKNVKIESIKKDNFGRILAFVFLDKLHINKALVVEGLAQFNNDPKQTAYSFELTKAQEEAILAKRGIWSNICQNLPQPNCLIKGNFRADTKTKIYHLPGCFNYDKITLNVKEGDRWFCSEEEASRAGFVKSKDCPL